MTDTKKDFEVGDLYRCESCEFEIHIVKPCPCEDGCPSLNCCSEPMTRVTALEVQNP